jgi:MoxR-like ATPase
VITNFNAESQGITSDVVIDRLMAELPERSANDQVVPELARAFAGA